MEETIRPTLLCVDDERQLLDSMGLFLRRRYELLTAESGAEGIRLLRANPAICAIMSDMRMPGMDGITFLHAARTIAPDVPRMLLTGYADIDTALAAINDGRVFRFLLKPSPPAQVLEAFEAALAQYHLVTAERELLEHTLRGAVEALSDVLSLSQPAAFGHAVRIKLLGGELAGVLLPQHRWAVEVAAMLAPLGSVSLPSEVADKLHDGRPL
ncbi:MAG TPA: response regulator, partial [Solimonas sp.]|nr:response regulator [Solimonas sp.]